MSPGACPGSRAIKDPTPEYVDCPQCGYEVEIWTHELVRRCPQCNTSVMRQRQMSCIDWCAYAQECVGPEIYAQLKPEAAKGPLHSSEPVQVLSHQHEEALKWLGILRGACLCLRMGSRRSSAAMAPTLAQATQNLAEALHFFDGEVRDHFRKEEQALFPILERHVGGEGSPIGHMLGEHQEIWLRIDELKSVAKTLPHGGTGIAIDLADHLERSATEVIRRLRSHIEKENSVLLPLASAKLSVAEWDEISRIWAAPGKPLTADQDS